MVSCLMGDSTALASAIVRCCHKYVVMAVAYDEDVAAITYQNQELTPLDINGYHLFYGTGTGKYEVYELFDQEGNRLEHIKE